MVWGCQEIQDLQQKNQEWDAAFIEACNDYALTKVWKDILTSAYTQNGVWWGAWEKNSINPFQDSTLIKIRNSTPTNIEKPNIENPNIENPHNERILLSSLISPQNHPSAIPFPRLEIPYTHIQGDLFINEPFHLHAPYLQEVEGNVNLELCDLASLPKLRKVGGRLTLPSKPAWLPQLELVGKDLVTPNSPWAPSSTPTSIELPKLRGIGGGLYIHHKNNINLPELHFIGSDLIMEGPLNANKLEYVGRRLNILDLKKIHFPQLRRAGQLETKQASKVNLPRLESCDYIDENTTKQLSLQSIQKLLKNGNNLGSTKKYLKEAEARQLNKLKGLLELQNNRIS